MASHAQALVRALNAQSKSAQFSASKARATARTDPNVDWAATKQLNDGFNPEVDGCESFVMSDGSICEWSTPANAYHARGT